LRHSGRSIPDVRLATAASFRSPLRLLFMPAYVAAMPNYRHGFAPAGDFGERG
jgi:hypothetical protein